MLIIITGPTASGKTAIAEEIGRRSNGEIISADSRTLYRDLKIGTGRYTLSDDLKYHMIDLLGPDEFISVREFIIKARDACSDIERRGKIPILCGGTMHYIDRFIKGIDPNPPPDPALRRKLKRISRDHGPDRVHEMLKQMDPDMASTVHPNNLERTIRYIERAGCKQKREAIKPFSEKFIHIFIVK